MLVIQTIVLLLIVYILHNTYHKYRKIHDKQLPGPFPIPILGNLHQLSDLPHRDITKYTNKYGDIIRIWFSDLYTVLISDPVLIRKIYIENHENFRDRPRIPSMKYGTYFHGTAASSGEDWVRNRELVSKAMRKTNIKHIYELMNDQIDLLLKSMNLISKEGRAFEPRYFMSKYTMGLMYKFIFNEKTDEEIDDYKKGGEIQQLHEIMSKSMEDLATGSLFDVLEISRPLYFMYLETFDKSFPKLVKFFEVRYKQHLETFNPEVSRDLLDTLIGEYGGGDPTKTTHDDFLNIVSSVLDFFFAGVDTSSTTLEYLVMILCNYPDVQEKVYGEIKGLNKQFIELSDKSSLPYLQAVIKETMRYRPVTSFGLPRTTNQDIIIDDKYFIPKDSQILINYHKLFQNEKFFPNPHQFNPNRFIDEPNNSAFIPFSIGSRNCVGASFAQDEMFICIANCILNFRFKSIDGKKIDENEKYGITLKPKECFKVLLEKRL